jgi:transcriptional regulator with XRE-family HTH domain
MTNEISGIKGEYRRPNSGEIAMLVRMFRQARGIKQAALAAAADVAERTLERLEAGKSVSSETYRRVAIELGLDAGAFIDERYIATPHEAFERVERRLDELEKTHVRVPVAHATDLRQILRLLDPAALIFDDSQIKVEHLETSAELKQLLLDWRDIASDLDEPGKLKAARGVLEAIERLESLGYVVKVGVAESYPASGNSIWAMALAKVYPQPGSAREALPTEVLLKTGLKMSLG